MGEQGIGRRSQSGKQFLEAGCRGKGRGESRLWKHIVGKQVVRMQTVGEGDGERQK